MTLDMVEVGMIVEVVKVEGEKPLKRRLMDMGLVRGVKVEVKKMAPMKDPIEIRVMDYELSLRMEEAKHIFVK